MPRDVISNHGIEHVSGAIFDEDALRRLGIFRCCAFDGNVPGLARNEGYENPRSLVLDGTFQIQRTSSGACIDRRLRMPLFRPFRVDGVACFMSVTHIVAVPRGMAARIIFLCAGAGSESFAGFAATWSRA